MRETSADRPSTYATLSDAAGAWDLWFLLCDSPRCGCRDVLVLATREGRDVLEPLARRVEAAWVAGDRPNERAAALTGVGGAVLGFSLDLDAPAPAPLRGAALDPRAAAAAERLTGDLLDDLHRRWFACKGLPPPPPSTEWEAEWKPGDLVAWADVHPGDRPDGYQVDGTQYVCDELYCARPGCSCNDLVVSFVDLEAEKEVGWTRVDHRTGRALERGGRQDLWDRYLARNPRWQARAATRQASLRARAERLVPTRTAASHPTPTFAPRPPKVGRNDDCPCGSGRKYKKCCGRAA